MPSTVRHGSDWRPSSSMPWKPASANASRKPVSVSAPGDAPRPKLGILLQMVRHRLVAHDVGDDGSAPPPQDPKHL